MVSTSVKMNTSPFIYDELLLCGSLLKVNDKARIQHANGSVTFLCLCLRHWYDKKDGFVNRRTRTDSEVIHLAKQWALQITQNS